MSAKPQSCSDPADLNTIRQEAMDFANVGLYRYKPNGEIIFIDHVALRMLDLETTYPNPNDLVGTDIGSLFVRLLPEGAHRSEVIRKGRVRDFEYHYRTLSGKERWSQHCSYIVRDPVSGRQAIQVLCKDVTELKEAARALAASESKYRSLAEQSTQGICLLQSGSLQPVFANRALADLFGCAVDTLMNADGNPLLPYIHPDDRDAVLAHCRRHVDNPADATTCEFRIQRHEFPLWVTATMQSVDLEGRPVLQLTLTDTTELRVQAERESRRRVAETHRQRLESLGMLAGGIAHDFNNILAGILGNAELALIEPDATDLVHERLQTIVDSSRRAAALCRQLLAYAGEGGVVHAQINLNDIVGNALQLAEITALGRAAIELDLDPALPAVLGEQSMLSQVVLSLVSNATEAIRDPDGRITISTASRSVDTDTADDGWMGAPLEPGTYAMLEVSDNGSGMDANTLAHIFDPFFTTKFAGRGLGLASVFGIVRAHRGAIRVHSEPGHGSRFQILLPPAPDTQPTDDTTSGVPRGSARSGTIVLADDQASVRLSIRHMLEHAGFTVVEAEDGRGVVTCLEQHRQAARAAVLDLSMPGPTVSRTIARMRSLSPGLPVLVISGYERDLAPELSRMNAVDFLQKPFGMGELYAALNRLLKAPAGHT